MFHIYEMEDSMKRINIAALAIFSMIAAAMGTFLGLLWVVIL